MHVFCCYCMYNAGMPSVTIRDVPQDTRNELAARAAQSGRSLQEYLRQELIKLAERPDPEALMATVREFRQGTGRGLSVEEILEYRDSGRR